MLQKRLVRKTSRQLLGRTLLLCIPCKVATRKHWRNLRSPRGCLGRWETAFGRKRLRRKGLNLRDRLKTALELSWSRRLQCWEIFRSHCPDGAQNSSPLLETGTF